MQSSLVRAASKRLLRPTTTTITHNQFLWKLCGTRWASSTMFLQVRAASPMQRSVAGSRREKSLHSSQITQQHHHDNHDEGEALPSNKQHHHDNHDEGEALPSNNPRSSNKDLRPEKFTPAFLLRHAPGTCRCSIATCWSSTGGPIECMRYKKQQAAA